MSLIKDSVKTPDYIQKTTYFKKKFSLSLISAWFRLRKDCGVGSKHWV